MDKINTDTATISGFWIGIGGFVAGIVGIGLTLYSFFKAPDVLILTSSGWIAAVLSTVACGCLCHRLIKLTASLSHRISELTQELADIKHEKQSLITISDFLATKAVRQATPRKIRGTAADIAQPAHKAEAE